MGIESLRTYTNDTDDRVKRLAYDVARLASDHKGFNIRICDLNEHCAFASYFVLISCSSTRQTSAIADAIVSEYKINPSTVEGRTLGEWVLIDLGDVVVHVFDQSTRDFYMLDKAWGHVPSELYIDSDAKDKPEPYPTSVNARLL